MKHLLFIIFLLLTITVSHAQIDTFEVCKHGFAGYQHQLLKQPVIEEQTWIDAVYYHLDLTFETSPSYNLIGTVTGTFRILEDGVDELVLNFNRYTQSGYQWANFSVSGQAVSWQFEGDLLRITLDQAYNENAMVTVTVHYEGLPESTGLTFVEDFYHSGSPLVISSLSEPFLARSWWPSKDIPKDKADSVDITLTVPENFLAGSNGTLVNTTDNGNSTTTFYWQERYPITTYLVSVAIAEYAFFEETWNYNDQQMPLYFYCLPEDASDADYFFSVMPGMLTSFSGLFGIYPFINEKYGHAYFTHGGAMEHQTLSSFYNGYMTSERVYAHELAHQWFGDLVTCESWSEIWMNEGFASYSEALWYEQSQDFDRYLTHIHSYIPATNNFAAGRIYVTDTTHIGSIFSSTVYRKGMWVLHMLRYLLGEDTFFNILHNYAYDEQFKFKTATTTKFKNYCEEISGQQLDTFFDQWIYAYGFPIYEWNWGMTGSDSLFLVIKQIQDYSDFGNEVPFYEMPVEVALQFQNGSMEIVTVANSAAEKETFFLPVEGIVNNVSFDPTGWILNQNYYNSNLVPDSIDDIPDVISDFMILSSYPNPFPNPGNPQVTIRFKMLRSGMVNLKIYNALGQEVYSVNEYHIARSLQTFTWNGRDHHGAETPGGVYFARLQQGKFNAAAKILKLK